MDLYLYLSRNKEQPGLECTNRTQRITCQTLDLFVEEYLELAKRAFRIEEKFGLKSAPMDHLPKAVFGVKLQTISSAIIREPLSIFFYINYDLDSSRIRAPPAVHLRKRAVWFREDTSILIPKPRPDAEEKE